MINTAVSIKELSLLSNTLRAKVVEMSHAAKAPHLGSSLSCIDILTILYWKVLSINPNNPHDPNRDRFILSKGHAAAAFYAALAHRGFFPLDVLDTYVKNGSSLAEHPSPHGIPGVEAATGSLGHGLPVALGMALAAKIQQRKYRVFVLLSDGECNEGSVWEAALFAAANKLDNVIAFVDYNKWQATGRSNDVLGLHSLQQKWQAFGWNCVEVDGHSFQDLLMAITTNPPLGKPTMIICHTIKGKGISFMEDDNNWHYRIPTVEEVRKAKQELGIR